MKRGTQCQTVVLLILLIPKSPFHTGTPEHLLSIKSDQSESRRCLQTCWGFSSWFEQGVSVLGWDKHTAFLIDVEYLVVHDQIPPCALDLSDCFGINPHCQKLLDLVRPFGRLFLIIVFFTLGYFYSSV